MDYNYIGNFLDRFKKLLFQKEEIKDFTASIISQVLSHKIDKKFLKIKDGFIYIECSPVLHNEILIHKKQILEKLKDNISNYNFIDIR